MPTLRQFKTAVSNTSNAWEWSATFDSSPLPGSLLVAAAGYIGSTSFSKDTTVRGFTNLVLPDTGSIGLIAAAKLAGSSESSQVWVDMVDDTTNSQSLVIAEFTGSFNAASVSEAEAVKSRFTSGTDFTSYDCPPVEVSGTRLVVPVLGTNGEASSPTMSGHTLIGFARPGSSHWHRSAGASWAEVTDEAAYEPTWSWTGGISSVAAGQMAFPFAPSGGGMTLSGASTSAVTLSWTDNADGPWDVLRDGVDLVTGLTSPEFTDATVTSGTYTYQVRDASSELSNQHPVTVEVTAEGGVFWLRRDGSSWTSGGA